MISSIRKDEKTESRGLFVRPLLVVPVLFVFSVGCCKCNNDQYNCPEWTNSAGIVMVDIDKNYSIAKYETTQAQFLSVMGIIQAKF